MRRLLALFAACAIFFALTVVGSAGAQSTAGGVRTLRTATPATVAADGSTAAVATGCGRKVYRLYAWNPLRRSIVSLAPRRQRECYGASTGEGIGEQGIGGRRLAWVAYAGGNTREMWLRTASVARPRSTAELAHASYQTGSGLGDYVGNVHGDGSLLVFNTWSVCETPYEACPEGTPPGIHVYDEKVWRIIGQRKRLVLASPDEATVLSVAAGRILLQRDGSLELRAADGSLLRSFAFWPREVRAALLDASELVVLDHGDRLTWRVFDPVSGAEKRALSAGPRAAASDVERGLLVYTVGRVVHVLRLRDGRERRFLAPVVRPPKSDLTFPVRAQLEPSGLFFSYQVRNEARVRFIPFGQIRFTS